MRPEYEAAEKHPRWREWADMHRTRCMLLGGAAKGWGAQSHTYQLPTGAVAIDTLQPVGAGLEYLDRFHSMLGITAFYKWVRETPVTPQSNPTK